MKTSECNENNNNFKSLTRGDQNKYQPSRIGSAGMHRIDYKRSISSKRNDMQFKYGGISDHDDRSSIASPKACVTYRGKITSAYN